MKKILSFALFGFFIFNGFEVRACTCPLPIFCSKGSFDEYHERYKNAFLFRIIDNAYETTDVDDGTLTAGRITGEMQIEVLEVYKGDIEKISSIQNVSYSGYCDETGESATACVARCGQIKAEISNFKHGAKVLLFFDNRSDINFSMCGWSGLVLGTDDECYGKLLESLRPIWVREPIEH